MTQASIGELLSRGSGVLREAGVDAPLREAQLLLAHALGTDRLGLVSLGRSAVVDPTGFERLLSRRAGREPLAFLTGAQGFWSLSLSVSPDTLIPRADSEALVEALLVARPRRNRVRRVLDLGTGTGCLLLAVLSEYQLAWGVGVDLSPAACRLAAGNAAANGLGDRALVVCGDWEASRRGPFDVVLCNPPYIPSRDLDGLMPEVLRYEPARALDGGGDGLDAYRRLVPMLPRLLSPGGLGVLEVGIGQAASVAALGAGAGLALVSVRRDLGGVERAVLLERVDQP